MGKAVLERFDSHNGAGISASWNKLGLSIHILKQLADFMEEILMASSGPSLNKRKFILTDKTLEPERSSDRDSAPREKEFFTTGISSLHRQILQRERKFSIQGGDLGKMMSWNPHVPDYSKAIVTHDGATESSPAAWNQVPNGVPGHGDPLLMNSKRLQDELERYGSKIKEHEDNLKALKGQKNQLDDSIVDMQVRLGNYHSSSSVKLEGDESPYIRSHKDILEQIMKYDKSAAGIMCQLLSHQDFQKSSSIFTQDVIGVVASLGQVDDDAVSRLLSEYLGLDTMLAIVCKSYEGVQALEVYDNEGHVNKQSGIHGLGASIARPVQGRFRVICLENLRSYCGDFITNDPQKRLDIIKPKLPNGEIPAGFLGFAVNMIKVDAKHLYYLTASGCGIRETLFYNLLSRLQVYSTRADMLRALPCISDGAISLDGGMIRNNGIFFLGSREDVDLQFPKASKLEVPLEYLEIEKQMKKFEYERDRLKEEIKREQSLLDQVKFGFHKKKQEFVKFLADSSTYINQQQMNRYPPA